MAPNERRSRPSRALPLALALIGVSVTAVAAIADREAQDDAIDRRFRLVAEQARDRVQERLRSFEDSTTDFRNALLLSWPVDRVDFATLVALTDQTESLDAASALGFARAVPADAVGAFAARVRADDSLVNGGYPDFAVTPTDAGPDTRYIIEYLEPIATNEGAFGFDLGSNPSRRAAIEEAIDRGEAVASEPIDLVHSGERGIIVLHAVYDTGTVPDTAPSRRRHAVGVTSTALRIDDLLVDVLGTEPLVDLEIFDIGETVAETALEPTETGLLHRSSARVAMATRVEILDLDVGGRRWRLMLSPSEAFADRADRTPLLIGLGGLLITALVVAVVWMISSARSRAEALVARRTEELRQLILESPDATLVVDAEGVILLASNQVLPVLGHDPESLVGQSIDALVPLPLRAGHAALRAEFAAAPHSRRMAELTELSALRADGAQIPVEVNLAPVGDGTVIASVRDVTLQRAAREELERANEQKSAFLGTVSHELRTPLVAIRGFVQIIRTRGHALPESQVEEFLDRVVRNTDSLQRLIDELVEFSRLERDGFQAAPVPMDLADVVGDVVAQMRTPDLGHQVQTDLHPTACLADPVAVERIVRNLFANACKYSPPGTVVTVRVDGSGPDARLIVEDQGPGIPADERARVFERFHRGRLATSGAVAGTGIGLAVVADMVAAMGGTVSVDDAPGGGARFTVSFPLDHPSVRRDTLLT